MSDAIVVTIINEAGSRVNQAFFPLLINQTDTAVRLSAAKSWFAEPKMDHRDKKALL